MVTFIEYFQDKQNFINEILKHKNEDGVCITTIEEIAKGIGKSVTTTKNKYNSINERENVIQYVGIDDRTGKDKYIINIEDFKETSQGKALLKILDANIHNPTLLIDHTDIGIVNELGVKFKDIRRYRTFNWNASDIATSTNDKLSFLRDCIILDTETTGLTAGEDEILQLSIIDENGNTVYNSYFRPTFHKSWSGAEMINGISPEMVSDCSTFESELRNIIPIFLSAKKIIGYNTSFDLGILKTYGVYPNPQAEIVDVMRDFAPIYGEWSEHYEDYKWQKLITCADYYGYDWGEDRAHDSLADCRATLYCYKKITENKDGGNVD